MTPGVLHHRCGNGQRGTDLVMMTVRVPENVRAAFNAIAEVLGLSTEALLRQSIMAQINEDEPRNGAGLATPGEEHAGQSHRPFTSPAGGEE